MPLIFLPPTKLSTILVLHFSSIKLSPQEVSHGVVGFTELA